MADIRVADISTHQGTIDWNQLKNAIQGVVIKSTGADNGLYTDGRMAANRNEARRVGVPVWFYHYKGAGSARDQAKYMLQAIGPLREGEAVVIDDENEFKINTTFISEFSDTVKALTGMVPVVYSNLSRFQNVDLAPLRQRNIVAWVAKYGSNTGAIEGSGATPSGIDIPIVMWQYTSNARLPGITENTVDMNIFYGTVDQFKAYGYKGEDMKVTEELANILADTLRYQPGEGADTGFKSSFVGKELKDVLVAFQKSDEFEKRQILLNSDAAKATEKLLEIKKLNDEITKQLAS